MTITSATWPATDLGRLLRKHPDRWQEFELPFGTATVAYPRANDETCTVALHVEIDPVQLVRGRGDSFPITDAYVSDRPYAASSFLSVAIARVFGAALGGRSEPPEMAHEPRELRATVAPLRNRDDWCRRLFEPLGYRVEERATGATYATLEISAITTLSKLLNHLYVLIPALDGEKHYWVGDDEVDKLFRFGSGWLEAHPEREFITRRYLKRAPKLARAAVARLAALDDDIDEETRASAISEAQLERPMRLQEQRIAAAVETLRECGARRIVDVGCGQGDLALALAREPHVEHVLATDVSVRELERAKSRIERAAMLVDARAKIELYQTSALYADRRLQGADAIALLEVIEHVDEPRLPSLEAAIFGFAHPNTVIVTTPNSEYNRHFANLSASVFRHHDHRFEWTRSRFSTWCMDVAERFGYRVTFRPIGDSIEPNGPPTQMALFTCV